MSYKVYSVEMLKEERRKQTVEEKVPYIGPDGRENFVTKKIVNGEMEVLELDRPIGEMITTASGLAAVVQKPSLIWNSAGSRSRCSTNRYTGLSRTETSLGMWT